MLIWVTRPDLATVVIRGVPDCSVWLVKPEYNASERGVEIDPLYPENLLAGKRQMDIARQQK